MARSSGRQAPACYTIRVDGHLDDHWAAALSGDLTLTRDSDGTTSLTGPVADQAELHGLLIKVRDLGVTLISVAVVEPSNRVPQRDRDGGGDDVRMADGRSTRVERPGRARGRWTSFVAGEPDGGRAVRGLHEEGNPHHRVRVEHDRVTLLVHVSDEDGDGWTAIAIDRDSRAWSVAQRPTRREAAAGAVNALYRAAASPGRVD